LVNNVVCVASDNQHLDNYYYVPTIYVITVDSQWHRL